MLDADDVVELEDTSRSRNFVRVYREALDGEAKWDIEEWDGGEDEGEGVSEGDRVRIKSVSAMLYSSDFLRLSTSSTVRENAAAVAANREARSLLALTSLENVLKALVRSVFLV